MKNISKKLLIAATFFTASTALSEELRLSPQEMLDMNTISSLCEAFEQTNQNIVRPNPNDFCTELSTLREESATYSSYCSRILLERFLDDADKDEVKVLEASLTLKEASECLAIVNDILDRAFIDLLNKHNFQYGGTFKFTPTEPYTPQ